MHLTHEDLVLHYYGEAGADEPRIGSHLELCEECRASFAKLQQVLAIVESTPVEEPAPGFEREMWARLQDRLEPESGASSLVRRLLGRIGPTPFSGRLVLAGSLAAVLMAAFLAGWLARGVPQAPGTSPGTAATADAGAEQGAGPVRERVLLVAVGDHLERSQMVLVELMNAGDGDRISLAGERERASDLVAANRLFRQTAAMTGDEGLDDVLEDLERVLLEIANGPEHVSADELNVLRERIESRGILFRVRVLTSGMRTRQQETAVERQKGTQS